MFFEHSNEIIKVFALISQISFFSAFENDIFFEYFIWKDDENYFLSL